MQNYIPWYFGMIDFPGWDNYKVSLWPVESKPSVHFRLPNPETLDNQESYVFPDYQDFPVPANENERRICILHIKIHN